MIEAVIFDLDGTLVDSLEDIAVALDLALDDHGLVRPSRATVRKWIGGGMRSLIARALAAQSQPDDRIDPILARFREHYMAAPVVHTRLYEGLDRVLDRFAARDFALAVCSNKAHALTVAIADVLLTKWPFRSVIGQRDHVKLKPAPDAALEIAAALGVAPGACAFVGDSEVDIETAVAAGMMPVGVSWGFRPRAELAGAAVIADVPAELLILSETRAS